MGQGSSYSRGEGGWGAVGSTLVVARPRLLVYFAILSLLLLAGCTSQPPPAPTPTPVTVTPTATATLLPTPTLTPSPTPSVLEQAITDYYQALQEQNYPLAYSFLDPNAIIINGQHITLNSFTQMAKARYTQYGPILRFSVSPYLPVATVTVIRKSYAYHAHLTLKQEQGKWKITSFDLI